MTLTTAECVVPVLEIFHFSDWIKFVPKKASEPVSKNFGAEKCFWIGLEKRLWIGIVKIVGLVTHWTTDALLLKLSLIGDSSTYRDLFKTFWVPIYFSGSLFAMIWLDSHEKFSLGSLLGPYFIKNGAPIGSQFHKKLGPYSYARRSLKVLATVLITMITMTTDDNKYLTSTDDY